MLMMHDTNSLKIFASKMFINPLKKPKKQKTKQNKTKTTTHTPPTPPHTQFYSKAWHVMWMQQGRIRHLSHNYMSFLVDLKIQVKHTITHPVQVWSLSSSILLEETIHLQIIDKKLASPAKKKCRYDFLHSQVNMVNINVICKKKNTLIFLK